VLTEAEYVQQQISLGHRIHEHDGVWWDEAFPFYCKPAFVFRAFDPGSAKPSLRHSLLGYSHQVATNAQGNRSVAFMELGGDNLRRFSLATVKNVKRNQVRKGLKSCETALIGDLERNLESARQINISQSIRQADRFGAETPVSRYINEADQWCAQVRREFALRGREWWGSFAEGALVAYMVTYQVADVRIIEKVKSHSDYLRYCPVDALYFTVLEAASRNAECKRVICGQPQHPTLNHFKEQFLFEVRNYPYYSTHAKLIEWAKRMTAGSGK
jgi:hypothetical protein